jgi:hypothetical protein
MQALAYARETGDRIEMIGISKPPCEQHLDQQNVAHHQDEDGLQNPRNWESPDKIEVEKFAKVVKPKVKVEGDWMHHQVFNFTNIFTGCFNHVNSIFRVPWIARK